MTEPTAHDLIEEIDADLTRLAQKIRESADDPEKAKALADELSDAGSTMTSMAQGQARSASHPRTADRHDEISRSYRGEAPEGTPRYG